MQEKHTMPAPARHYFWNDPDKRALVFQIIVTVAILGLAFVVVENTLSNLEKRGITTGFDFLSQESGFGIIQSLVEYDETHSFGKTFIVGLLNTILVSVLGIILATVVGFLVGVGRLSNNWLVARVCGAYVEIFRNIPLLLQILFWYFAVLRTLPSPRQSLDLYDTFFLNIRGLYIPAPVFQEGAVWIGVALLLAVASVWAIKRWAQQRQLTSGKTFPVFYTAAVIVIGLPLLAWFMTGQPVHWEIPALKGFNFRGGYAVIPELCALLIALTLYTASYIAENVRSGIEAVNKGQTEAAFALGLPKSRTMQLVIIPQAMRVIIPPLASQYMNLIKNSSLATAVGYPDLVAVFAGTTLNQTGQAVEIILITMSVYLLMSLLVSLLMNMFNKKMALAER
ncbi:amino acid ABC transporter permease [Endozoicomonadaceae bacterium StTr2]